MVCLFNVFLDSSKIEKEKRQQAERAGMVRTEISGAEVSLLGGLLSTVCDIRCVCMVVMIVDWLECCSQR